MKLSTFKRVAHPALGALIVVLLLPLTALAAHKFSIGSHRLVGRADSPAIVFGRQGGNIMPFSVSISNSGRIGTQGAIGGTTPRTQITTDALNGLLKLAEAEGFFGMPNFNGTNSPAFSDTATLYITIHSSAGAKTVKVHAARIAAFNQLFAVLMATTNVG